jgi:hypothetical protein
MGKFLTPLDTRKVLGRSSKYILLADLKYRDDDGTLITAPKGFESDGTTNFVRGRHEHASWIHDYLLAQGFTRTYARRVMNRAMKAAESRWLTRQIIRAGVMANDFRHWIFQ